MVVWKSVRLTKVEGESKGEMEMKEFNIDLNVIDLQIEEKDIRVDFNHSVNYGEDVGFIKFTGFLIASGTQAEIKEIEQKWKGRKLPVKFASDLTNAIMFNCEVNGVLVTRVLGMPAPVVPPQIGIRG